MRTLLQSVRKWRKIYLSPFIVPCQGLRIEVHFVLFALGNERTLVTCKSSRFSKIYTRPVSFHFPMQTKKCSSILKFMLEWQITPKNKKNQCQFFSEPGRMSGKLIGHMTSVFRWISYASSQANDIGVKIYYLQANSENCGPPLGNKFDLEVGQRSPSRSQHGTTGKVLSQGTHMPSFKALSVIVQKLWQRLKFLWQTDRQTDGRTGGQTDEWELISPRFPESGGQKHKLCYYQI